MKVSRVTADRPRNSVDCLSNPLLLLPSLVKKEEKQKKTQNSELSRSLNGSGTAHLPLLHLCMHKDGSPRKRLRKNYS